MAVAIIVPNAASPPIHRLGRSDRHNTPGRRNGLFQSEVGAHCGRALRWQTRPTFAFRISVANSLFHEPWWLSAATADRYEEVVVEQGGKIVGRLPYLPTPRGPYRLSRMPPFTHLLGPVIDAGVGKPQTRLTRRLSITRALIDKLPPLIHFEQQLDPTMDEGLAIADGLAFQDRGFEVAHRYTFEIDCRKELECLWDAMHFKTRQHIRRAEEKYTAQAIDDPAIFAQGYLSNIKALGKTSWVEFERFPALFAECRSRNPPADTTRRA